MAFTQTWTWFEGEWHEGNPPIMGPRTHAFWLGSSVFDGARAFEGVTPDLDAASRPGQQLGADAWHEPHHERRDDDGPRAARAWPSSAPNAELYIRPMYWPEESGIERRSCPTPDSTRFCLCIYEAPMPQAAGSSITLSPFRRPTIENAPVNAKAGCLYPNNARAMREARTRGFDNCLLADMLGNVAELATANIFMAQGRRACSRPIPNGTFLNGITRQRVVKLLRRMPDRRVVEGTLTYADFQAADEIFSAGNYGKVQPVTRIDDRDLQPGPHLPQGARALLGVRPRGLIGRAIYLSLTMLAQHPGETLDCAP